MLLGRDTAARTSGSSTGPSAGPAAFELRYDPERHSRVLALVAVGFALVSFVRGALAVTGHIGEARAVVLDVNDENSVSTWYQGVQMGYAALLLWTVARERLRAGDRWARQWVVLVAGLALMSLDELISIHEKLTRLRHHLPKTGFLYYGWIAVALPLLVVLGVYFLAFLRDLPRRTRNGFLLAGAVYLTGAVVLESIGGEIVTHYGNDNNFPYLLESTVEELLEPLGIILLLATLARYVQAHRRAPVPELSQPTS